MKNKESLIIAASLILLFGILGIQQNWFSLTISVSFLLIFVLIIYVSKNHRFILLLINLFMITSILGLTFIKTKLEVIFNQTDYEEKEFSIYVLNNHNQDIKDKELLYPIQFKDEVMNVISFELVDLNLDYQEVNSIDEGIESLLDANRDALIIDNAYLDSLNPLHQRLLSEAKIIRSFDTKIVKEALTKPKDINQFPFVVYISGIDTLGPINTVARSDVNIIAIVHPSQGIIDLTSIARDSYLPIPCKDNTMDKLTHTGWYGINCSVDTLEQLLDLDVNYYIKLNFSSFLKIIDVFETIEVNSEFAFSSGGYSFKKGLNEMNAEKALAFVRTRKVFELGDLQRGLNQQQVIKAILLRLSKIQSLNQLNEVIEIIQQSIDTNIDANDLAKLIQLQIFSQPDWDIRTSYIEGTRGSAPSFAFGGEYHNMVFLDDASINRTKEKIQKLLSLR